MLLVPFIYLLPPPPQITSNPQKTRKIESFSYFFFSCILFESFNISISKMQQPQPKKSYTDVRSIYKLRDWIRESDLVLESIYVNPSEGAAHLFHHLTYPYFQESYLKHANVCLNPSEWARDFILDHPEYLNYYNLSQNPAEWVGEIFEGRLDLVDWNVIAHNPAEWAGKIVQNRIRNRSSKVFLDLYHLFLNPAEWAGEIIRKYSMQPVWYLLSENPAQWAGDMCLRNLHKISYGHLSRNPAEWARKILEKTPDKIDYQMLCLNPAEWAREILEQNPKKMAWEWIARNGSNWAVELLENNRNRIHWSSFSQNPHIFIYDYQFLRERMRETIAEELMQNRFHPRNLSKFAGWGYEGLEEDDFCE